MYKNMKYETCMYFMYKYVFYIFYNIYDPTVFIWWLWLQSLKVFYYVNKPHPNIGRAFLTTSLSHCFYL